MKINLRNEVTAILKDSSMNDFGLRDTLTHLIYNFGADHDGIEPSQNIVELIEETISFTQSEGHPSSKIKTGFTHFDENFGGLSLGELVVIGSRPSMGKTVLLTHLAIQISQSETPLYEEIIGINSTNINSQSSTRHPVLFISYDHSQREFAERLVTTILGTPYKQEIADESMRITIESKINKCNFISNFSSNNTIEACKLICEKHILEDGIKVIIIDYVQLLSSIKFPDHKKRELAVSHIIRELKTIAKDYNVCVIAASQLNRAVEIRGGDKIPLLSDLRESGSIEQVADKVIFVYRPAYYGLDSAEDGSSNKNRMYLIVAKNKNGQLGEVLLKFDSSMLQITEDLTDQTITDFSIYTYDPSDDMK